MTHRTVVNCETGVVTQVEYTAEEQAVHDAATVAWNAEQSLIQVQPTMQDLIIQQQALITQLQADVAALKGTP
jgi:hypothetical protein